MIAGTPNKSCAAPSDIGRCNGDVVDFKLPHGAPYRGQLPPVRAAQPNIGIDRALGLEQRQRRGHRNVGRDHAERAIEQARFGIAGDPAGNARARGPEVEIGERLLGRGDRNVTGETRAETVEFWLRR
ncbi:hypothetical protein N8D56_10025 [Devosia sp. A8/3-2]|nr:hypothetical protein N8D56_10025 [Devosia sp. A8/3-2]